MTEPRADEKKDAGEEPKPASAQPADSPVRDAKPAKAESDAAADPYWWVPWAVLVGLVLYGLLGYLGVLFPQRKGPTAADVPTKPASSDTRLVPSR